MSLSGSESSFPSLLATSCYCCPRLFPGECSHHYYHGPFFSSYCYSSSLDDEPHCIPHGLIILHGVFPLSHNGLLCLVLAMVALTLTSANYGYPFYDMPSPYIPLTPAFYLHHFQVPQPSVVPPEGSVLLTGLASALPVVSPSRVILATLFSGFLFGFLGFHPCQRPSVISQGLWCSIVCGSSSYPRIPIQTWRPLGDPSPMST